MTDTPDQKPADALWQYWFSLKTSARTGQWDVLRHQMAYEPDHPLPVHPFLIDVFHAAANEGQSDIVETLFERGFALDAETLRETLTRLAIHHTEKSGDVLRVLVKNGAETEDAAISAAAKGRLDSLHALDAAGADVRAGNSGFFIALYSGQPAVMNYLHEKGAAIYHPAVIAAQYGRKKELPAEKANIALDVYRSLVGLDNLDYTALHAAAGGAPEKISALREQVSNADGLVFTRLQIAVRAGKWDDIRAAVQNDKTDVLRADDFLMPDAAGLRPFDMAAAQGALDKLFDPAIWYRVPQEMKKLHQALSDIRAENVVNLENLVADMHRREIGDILPAAQSFRLARRAGPRP